MIDKLTDEVRKDSLSYMVFADNRVIYTESREQVKEIGEVEVCAGERRNESQ